MDESANTDLPLSLNFLSTQIQSRYEDQEHSDSRIARLQQFKNVIENKPKNIVTLLKLQQNQKQKPKQKRPKNLRKKIVLLSAFVRESFATKKPIDSHSILDYFKGEKEKADEFISLLDSVTATPASRAELQNGLPLFNAEEWCKILDTLRLKFPNLSSPKKKSLKLITKRLKLLKERERESSTQLTQEDNLQSLWSQASNQPHADLTTDELKWLYDLDDEQVVHNTSIDEHEESSQSPFVFTLSQLVNNSLQQMTKSSSPILDNESTIDDSEPELKALEESELVELIDTSQNTRTQNMMEVDLEQNPFVLPKLPNCIKYLASNSTTPRLSISHPHKKEQRFPSDETVSLDQTNLSNVPPHQKNKTMDSADILTSIVFPQAEENPETSPYCNKAYKSSSSVVELNSPSEQGINSSPFKAPAIPHQNPSDWPVDLAIDSSPVLTPEDNSQVSSAQVRELSPLGTLMRLNPSINFTSVQSLRLREEVEFVGKVELLSTDSSVKLLMATKNTDNAEQIPDSEDENEVLNIITVEYVTQIKSAAVLQVPSSP